MRNCPTCGAQLPDEAQFCSVCGTKIAEVVAQPTPQPVQPEPQPVQPEPTVEPEPAKVAPKQEKQPVDPSTLSRDELIAALAPMIKPLELLDRIDEQIAGAEKNQKNVKKHGFFFYFWPWLILDILGGIIELIIIALSYFGSNGLNMTGIIVTIFLYIVFIIFGVGLAVLLTILSANKKKKKIAKIDKDINNMRNDQMNIIEHLGADILMVPRDYRYALAVTCMVEYLNNMRADNLKEAVNLYEEQLHRWKLENAAERMVQLQRSVQTSSKISAAMSTANFIYNVTR